MSAFESFHGGVNVNCSVKVQSKFHFHSPTGSSKGTDTSKTNPYFQKDCPSFDSTELLKYEWDVSWGVTCKNYFGFYCVVS